MLKVGNEVLWYDPARIQPIGLRATIQSLGTDGKARILLSSSGKLEDVLSEHLQPISDLINSPAHYTSGGIETIDFIEAKQLTYHLGNAVKYISRAGRKGDAVEDLKKARWYIDRAIEKAQA